MLEALEHNGVPKVTKEYVEERVNLTQFHDGILVTPRPLYMAPVCLNGLTQRPWTPCLDPSSWFVPGLPTVSPHWNVLLYVIPMDVSV